MREVDVVLAGHQRVEIVAADAALHFGKTLGDLTGLARADGEQILRERPQRRGHVLEIAANAAEMRKLAVGQQRLNRDDVVAHRAVAHRAPAARVVAGHATDGRPRGCRDVDGKPQPVRLELAIEIVEHDAGLDCHAPVLDVEIQDAREVLRAIDDERFADGLAGLRRAAAARQDGRPLAAGNRYCAISLLDRARRDHAHRHDLIVGGIG